MDKKRAFTILAVGLILMACAGHLMAQSTLDTALTYQGFLKRNNSPVNRMMDLRFALFADPNATQQIGGQLEAIGVDVMDGHFALELDFGAAPFTGEPRWLQTELRRNDRPDDPYIPQTPLLRLTLSPYAIYADRARYVQDGITGRGAAGSIPRFTDPNTIGDSVIFENAGNVGIGTQTPNEKLSVDGVIESTGGIRFSDGTLQRTTAKEYPLTFGESVWLPNNPPSGGEANQWFECPSGYVMTGFHRYCPGECQYGGNHAFRIKCTSIDTMSALAASIRESFLKPTALIK